MGRDPARPPQMRYAALALILILALALNPREE